MATIHGSGVYGLDDESSVGIYIGDLTLDATIEEVFLPNHVGDDIGVSFFNEGGTLNANGALVATETVGSGFTLGAEIPTIANAGIYANDSTVTDWYVNSINLRKENRGFESGSWTATGRPGITTA